MKKIFLGLFLLSIGFTKIGFCQSKSDLFKKSSVPIVWLGVDFSHVKLIGDFSQFFNAGEKSTNEIRDRYFTEWNQLILSEPAKYNLEGMLRKDAIQMDIEMIEQLNLTTPLENLEASNTPKYNLDSIKRFVSAYNIASAEKIGIAFIAESLNKNKKEAYFHFIAINLNNKEILVHERLRGEPAGFGLRNYWAGSIYRIMKDIEKIYYKKWKKE